MEVEMENKDYETQFFGFDPALFMDAAYTANYTSVNNAIHILHGSLLSKYPNVNKTDLMKGSESLRMETLNSGEGICDKLEAYLLRNVFIIPKHVTLPEDLVHLETDIRVGETLDAELLQLMTEIKVVTDTISNYKQESLMMESVIESYRNTVELIYEMLDKCQQLGVTGVEESIVACASNVIDLIELVDSIQQLPKAQPL